jgi:hypothetical protein
MIDDLLGVNFQEVDIERNNIYGVVPEATVPETVSDDDELTDAEL